MCLRRASLLWFVPGDKLRLRTPGQDAATDLFHTHVIRHRFCANCGIHAFAEGTVPAGSKMAAINIRCVENLDLSSIPVKHFDGRSS